MQNIPVAVKQRIEQEWQDLSVRYPQWLNAILDDELYYTVTLTIVCACSFCVGLAIGWLKTL
jgi:hypothetical protein